MDILVLWAWNVVFVCNTESIFLCVSTSEAQSPPATHYHFNHWLWARVWCLVFLTHSVDAAIKQNCRKKHVFQWNIFYFNFLCAGGYSLRGDDSGFLMLKNTTKVKWSYRQRGLWMHLEWEIKSTFDKLFAISQKRYKIDTSDTFCERRIACTFYRIVTLRWHWLTRITPSYLVFHVFGLVWLNRVLILYDRPHTLAWQTTPK